MPKTPTDSAKNVTGDFATFTEFMRKLMKVPHSEIKAAMESDRAVKRVSGPAFLARVDSHFLKNGFKTRAEFRIF